MTRKTDRPNVLFIMSDQHRYDYLETAENAPAALNTPNLRRLAETGVSFPNCTVNAPVCAPSRIALASGLQPSRLGAVDNGSFLPPPCRPTTNNSATTVIASDVSASLTSC